MDAGEVDITSLLQPRQGYLYKLKGGQETGSKWNRRWFVLRDNVLMYFNSPKDFMGFRDKPSGVVLLEECNVRMRDEKGAQRLFTFVLAHPNGESVVLGAESEKEMHEWMQAVRTSRMCITDAEAANQTEAHRRQAAEYQLDGAQALRNDAEEELTSIEKELETVHTEHRQVEVEREKAEKELKELMARFKLRKALLHWRHRKLTLSFRALVSMVFKHRINQARQIKSVAESRMAGMQEEIDGLVASRQKAEAAKRKSEEMLSKELALKKEGESEAREASKLLTQATEKSLQATQGIAQLQSDGAEGLSMDKEKDELLQLCAMLYDARTDVEKLQLNLKRRTQMQKSKGSE